MLWVDFGCAGHGKGPWDGLGAVIKQRVQRDILHNNIRTASGYITSPAEVAEHLHKHFGTDEWKVTHVEKKVQEIIVLYSDATDISERAGVERSQYDPLTHAKKTFQYMMLDSGVIARRKHSHWCTACCGARGRGAGTTDSNLVVMGCSVCDDPQHQWEEQEVRRTDAAGIAQRRVVAQKEGHRLAGRLEAGMWLAAEDRTNGTGLWIGQAYKLPNGTCIHTKVEDRDETIAGTQFTRGDHAIAVRWWDPTSDDPEQRTYEEWEPTAEDIEKYGIETADGPYFICNSIELRHVGFQMDTVIEIGEESGATHVSRRTRRASAQPERPSRAGRRFRLPADVENQILALCWS